MDHFKPSAEVYERYMDAAAELFMEYYDHDITPPPEEAYQEPVAPAMAAKCKKLIATAHRRTKRKQFLKGSGRFVKVAAVLAMAVLSTGSLLFMSVSAVREPIIEFYAKGDDFFIVQKEGHINIYNSPYELEFDHPYFSDPNKRFKEDDPLGFLLPEGYYCDEVLGTVKEDEFYTASYFNEDKTEGVVFSISAPGGFHSINTEQCEVKEFTIDGDSAVLSQYLDGTGCVLMWYNAHLDKNITISATALTGQEAIDMADVLNYVFYKFY